MTGQDIIDVAWRIINDLRGDDSNKRYPLADMVDYLNDGMQDLYGRRPMHLLGADGSLGTYTELNTTTVSTTTLDISDTYREPMAHYLAYRTFAEDSGDDSNAGLAQQHFSLYLATT